MMLDHFWTNIVECPVKTGVIVDPISDHLPICLNLGIEHTSEVDTVEIRYFTDEAERKFINNLRQMNIQDILAENSTNKSYNMFISRYIDLFETSFPLREKRPKKKSSKVRPWYTNDLHLLNIIKQNDYLNHISNKDCEFFKIKYCSSRNLYFRKVKSAKRSYYQKHLIEVKNNVKETWKVINSTLGRYKTKGILKLSINGKEVKDKMAIANEFNSHFSQVSKKLVDKIQPCKWRKPFHKYLRNRNKSSFAMESTNPVEILKILKSLPSKLSSGWDNIPQKIVKLSPFNILIALSHIFNRSIIEGIFPDKMKIA